MLETRLSLTWKAKKPRELACKLIAAVLEPIAILFVPMAPELTATAEELVVDLLVFAAMLDALATICWDRAGT